MGLISGMFMGALFGMSIMASWRYMMKIRSKSRADKAADIKLLGSLDRDDLKKLCGDNYPEWISFPVYEQVKWLNKQLSKLWPYVAEAASIIIRESVEPILEEYRPSGISSLCLQGHLSLIKHNKNYNGINFGDVYGSFIWDVDYRRLALHDENSNSV